MSNNVSGVSSTGSNGSDSALTKATSSLDRDAFLKLLITEMRNQDPMKPMEDKDFIAQLAQFSSLEQMQKMNTGFDLFAKSSSANQSFAMIGKSVDYLDAESGTSVSGKVNSVSFLDGFPVLNVGTAQVEIGNVIKVY